MAPTSTAVSIEEYLRTSYRPDVQYIDGQIKQKPVVGFAHGRVQGLIFMWFEARRKEWATRPLWTRGLRCPRTMFVCQM